MIKNIVFDIGQVLVSFDWEGYLAGFGFSEELYAKIAEAVFLNEGWNESDRGLKSRSELADMFAANASEADKEIRQVFAGAGETISEREYAARWVEELKEKGYGVYFLSNYAAWCYEDTKEILDKFLSRMDGGVFSFQVHHLKPGKEIYLELLKRYELKPEECLFVDDREVNVKGAEAVGMNGIIFTSYEEIKEKLDQL